MNAKKRTFGKTMLAILILAAVVVFGAAGYLSYQYYGIPRCPACGMLITSEMMEHFVITDGQGNRLYACCQGCMLRLLDPVRGWEKLHIETFCDWYGPACKIVIDAEEHGNVVTVVPQTARILLGSKVVKSCANNRIAYNDTAVQQLLTHGYSQYTMKFQQHPLPEGTPVLPVPQAANMLATNVGIAYVAPNPWLIVGVVAIGVVILAGSGMAYKRLQSKS
jgi:hypothetical protein